jgi:hypothetical protein
MLTRITQLINSVLATEVEESPQLTEQQVVELIGEAASAKCASFSHSLPTVTFAAMGTTLIRLCL